ncbi:MAG: ArnT family glycosyltransferase [Pseudomonadales bacterium]
MKLISQRSFLLRLAVTLTLSCLALRLLSLGLYPLQDTTEARYAEMARIMVETGNWLTPMFDYEVPFWGKPPLFSWLSALGFSLFGVNEFAARLPHLILAVSALWLLAQFATRAGFLSGGEARRSEQWLCCAVLASSAVFFLIGAAVMTDSALLLAITLSMSAFLLHWQRSDKSSMGWGYLFFVGLALGSLAKGPLALVLVGISIVLWLLPGGRWRQLPHCLPWLSGTALYLALTLPWYIAAEVATPGFLQYFIIGEHFLRFVETGWQGDLYGTAHSQPRGKIWLLWCMATLPWIPLFMWQLARRARRYEGPQVRLTEGSTYYLVCWMLSPLLLFTFAGNILWSYVLPAVPAFALLLVVFQRQTPLPERCYLAGGITPVLFTILLVVFAFGGGKTSEKPLVQTWRAVSGEHAPLTYLEHRPFSARFYSAGTAKLDSRNLTDYAADMLSATKVESYIVVSNKVWRSAKPTQCQPLASHRHRTLAYCKW